MTKIPVKTADELEVEEAAALAAQAKALADGRLAARFGSRRGLPTLGRATHYVVARCPLRMGAEMLPVGAEVPGAAEWPRVEAWVRAGRIAPVFAEVAAAV